MEKIKRKIKVSEIKSGFLYINIHLTQSIKNIGTFTDVPFLISSVKSGKIDKYGRKPGFSLDEYFSNTTNNVRGVMRSSSNLQLFKRYGNTQNYTERYIRNKGSYKLNGLIKQWYDVFIDRRIEAHMEPVSDFWYQQQIDSDLTNSDSGNYTESEILVLDRFIYNYTLNGPENGYIDGEYPAFGINYQDIHDNQETYLETITKHKSQGQDYTNSSLSAIISEEYLSGITSIMDTESDLDQIERGNTSAFENVQRLSEINNINQISQYSDYFTEIN